MTPLGRAFYDRPTLDVAKDVLACALVRVDLDGTVRTARIVEAEAYTQDDPAYHGWNAVDAQTGLVRLTGRTHDFFGPPGRAYLYRVYTHWMLNLVTEPEGVCGSVLVRAADPLEGLGAMFAARPQASDVPSLCRGPGNLTAAFGLDGDWHGHDLTTGVPGPYGALFLADLRGTAHAPQPNERIAATSRIGLSRGTELPWRFFVVGHSAVSKGVPSDVAAARQRTSRRPR